MPFHRRQVLQGLGAAALTPVLSRTAWAQTYPTKPIHIIVGFAPGGAADLSARLTGQWLSERIGQSVVIENRTGAGSNIATEAVINSPADGYTLLLVTAANTINATLYSKLNFNYIADTTEVAGVLRVPNVMLVTPAVPAKTVAEFIAYAKANPGKLSYASAGVGTASHMAGELLKVMTGIDMVHVPYRGNALVLTGLLSGDVQLAFPDMPSSIEHAKSGKLLALGVTTAERSEAMADTPTIAETVPGYEASSWFAIAAPKKTPVEIINRLNREITTALSDPKAKARFAEIGGTVLPGSPADVDKLITDETAKWGKVVKFSGAKAE